METYLITDYGVRADCKELQTAALQAVLDLCKKDGGKVVVPRGTFYVGSLRLWSDTTLYLCEGARICGSDDCNDYEVYDIPEGMEMRSDMEMIPQQYDYRPWDAYRRAIITAYNEKNISIIGEKYSVIDGANCYDPDGEEGYRGPHAIFLSCCQNVLLEGYTAQHSGNFLHEANHCRNLTMRHVTCLAGSDGIHLHCTENTLIEECIFKTGDDCIAGINIRNMRVRRCIFNTSCSVFRMGGVGIYVEDCHAYGPGYYPHRVSIVKGKNDYLPREEGRHNMLSLVTYFASVTYPCEEASDIHFKNCVIENGKRLLDYEANNVKRLSAGSYLRELTLENVRLIGLDKTSYPIAAEDAPLAIKLKNVSYDFRESTQDTELIRINDHSFVTIVEE